MRYCILLMLCLCYCFRSSAQEKKDFFSWSEKKQAKFITGVNDKFQKLNKSIGNNAKKSLDKLERKEARIYRKLAKKDSAKANEMLAASKAKYAELREKLNGDSKRQLKEYFPAYDSLKTGIAFLDQGITGNSPLKEKILQSSTSLNQFGNSMQVANEIKKQLKERKQLLSKQLEQYGLSHQLNNFNKEVFYYQQQLNEYKSLLKDPKKIKQKALAALNNSSAFKEFMKKNSMIAQLFKLPDNYYSTENLATLQTNASVQASLTQRLAGAGADPQQYVNQQINQAQNEMNKLKSKLNKIGSGSSGDIDMPNSFKPNTQKTKSFFQRLEYGSNIQTQKVNSYFPVTTDVALSVGYKMNDKSVIGIGASYRLGLGSGIEHIKFSHEGVGLRSFVDFRLKAGIWATGGYEQNYMQRFQDFRVIRDINLWRQSALLGLTKKLRVKGKASKIQLMYDFFYNRHNVMTQPLIFRVGYNL
jgi:hypothetical protein